MLLDSPAMRTPFIALFLLVAASASAASPPPPAAKFPDAAALRKLDAQYAPVDLAVDVSSLPASERKALALLIEASRVVDALFLRQVWAGATAMLLSLQDDPSPLGRARLAFFLRNKGPWDRLDHDRIFIPGAPPSPEAGTFYPPGATKEEIAAWNGSLPEKERAIATGFFSVVRRTPGGFVAVPYSMEYQVELALAASLLRQAAAATAEPALKRFLETRASALLSDDYYDSDVAWMEIDGAVEPTFGPYETYGDGWFNAKAAFQAYVTVRDEGETAKLARLSGELQDIEDHLPMDPAWKNPKLGSLAPIRVVNQIFAAGDGRRGVTTAAFNLPNDERILSEKGAKRVMLKNVQEAKFQKVLLPISKVAIAPADGRRVSFDAFFTHILMHELVHGLGPHGLERPSGRTTVREQLGSQYAAIEEAKADVVGLFALHRLVDRGVLPKELERTMYATFLASCFRSIRFGVNEAHGRGVALQLNWFLDQGAVVVGKDGRFAVVDGKIRASVESLSREILAIQANGDAAGAKALLDRMAIVRPPVATVLERLRAIPVDVAPRFVAAEALTGR